MAQRAPWFYEHSPLSTFQGDNSPEDTSTGPSTHQLIRAATESPLSVTRRNEMFRLADSQKRRPEGTKSFEPAQILSVFSLLAMNSMLFYVNYRRFYLFFMLIFENFRGQKCTGGFSYVYSPLCIW